MKYKELDYKIQQKLLEKYWNCNLYDEMFTDQDGLLDVHPEWVEKYNLKDCLFTYDTIYYNLDSQGSYLQFKNLYVEDHTIFMKILGFPVEYQDYIQYSFYNRSDRNTRVEFNIDWNNVDYDTFEDFLPIENELLELFEDAEDKFNSLVEEALSNMKKHYDYLTSTKAIEDYLEDLEFDREGNEIYLISPCCHVEFYVDGSDSNYGICNGCNKSFRIEEDESNI